MVRKPPPSKRTASEPRFADNVKAAVVDHLPPTGYEHNVKRLRYQNKMAEVRKVVGPGKWVELVTYASRTTARATIRRLQAGDQPIDGKLSDWEMESRRTPEGGSAFYVKLKK